MARVKVLLYALLAVGLVYWAVSASSEAPNAAAKQADAQLAGVEKGFAAAVEVAQAHQRATAAELTRHPALIGALSSAADKEDGPSLDDAPQLQAALDQALAQLPEAERSYAAAALATEKGAIAIVPGHAPLSASSFTWLADALKAGATGTNADVAGKSVHVYAAPVRAVSEGKVKDLGTLAVAYAQDSAALAKIAQQFGAVTLVSGGKVLATSDQAHAEAAAKLAAPASQALVSGQPEAFLGFKLPLAPVTLVQARAFKVSGMDGVTAVATADLAPVAQAAAAGQKTGLIALLAILGLGLVVTALSGGAKAEAATRSEKPTFEEQPAPAKVEVEAKPHATPPPPPEPTAEIARQQPEPILTAEAALAEAEVEPAPAPLDEKPLTSTAAPTPPAPVQVAAAPAADPVPAFDQLFGSAPAKPAPAPSHAQIETRAAMPAASAARPPSAIPMPPATPPVQAKPAAPPAPTHMGGDVERTGLMSRDVLSALAAQSSIPQPDARNAASNQPAAIPLPGSAPAPFTEQMERTSVAAIPAELLRAATRPGVPAATPPGGSEEAHFQDVYREFMQTRERCGEPPENLTFDKFVTKLRKNKEQLVQKYACKSVRFQVYVKEGKAALKATPVKEA